MLCLCVCKWGHAQILALRHPFMFYYSFRSSAYSLFISTRLYCILIGCFLSSILLFNFLFFIFALLSCLLFYLMDNNEYMCAVFTPHKTHTSVLIWHARPQNQYILHACQNLHVHAIFMCLNSMHMHHAKKCHCMFIKCIHDRHAISGDKSV